MKSPLVLMLTGIGLLLLGGLPAVFEFMQMQGYPYNPLESIFPAHWYLMIFGFFASLIGNEVLVAMSVEWAGKPADDKIIISYTVLIIASALTFTFVNQQLGLTFLLMGMMILVYYSKVYLGPSVVGFRPTSYNWLLFLSLLLTVGLIGMQLGWGYTIPYYSLLFPVVTVFAVMARDVPLVTGLRISRIWEVVLSYIFLTVGMLAYPEGFIFMFLAWAFSFHASGLYKFKGRFYANLHLFTAWVYLLISAIVQPFQAYYDIYIHSLALGFLFNTVFGVDVVLMDMFVYSFGTRKRIKPTYIPYALLNLGLVMRFAFDLGLNSPILLAAAPLIGVGILSFFISTLGQIFLKDRVKAVQQNLIKSAVKK